MASKSREHLARNGALLALLGALASGLLFASLEGPPTLARDPGATSPAAATSP